MQMISTPRVTTSDTKAVVALGDMQGDPKPVSFLPVVSDSESMTLDGLLTLQDIVKCGL